MNVQQELVEELEDLLVRATWLLNATKEAAKMDQFEGIEDFTTGTISGMETMLSLIQNQVDVVRAGK